MCHPRFAYSGVVAYVPPITLSVGHRERLYTRARGSGIDGKWRQRCSSPRSGRGGLRRPRRMQTRSDTLRLCQVYSNRATVKSLALSEVDFCPPAHHTLKALLECASGLLGDPSPGSGGGCHGRWRRRCGTGANDSSSGTSLRCPDKACYSKIVYIH